MAAWDFLVDLFRGALFALTHVFGGSTGAAILTLSLIVRLSLFPLTLAAARRSRRFGEAMKKLEPELARLRAKFAKDPERLRVAMVELHRKHDIRPLRDSGMLGGLVQIPFVLALYSVIREGAGLAGRFLWIRNLARPDVALTFLVAGITGLSASVASAAGSGSGGSRWLAVVAAMFTVIVLSRLAAGVGLYWGVSSGVGILQGYVLRRQLRPPSR